MSYLHMRWREGRPPSPQFPEQLRIYAESGSELFEGRFSVSATAQAADVYF